MAEDEAPMLEATRKEQENLLAEVQEIKETLAGQLDDPAYENLDCRELEDLEISWEPFSRWDTDTRPSCQLRRQKQTPK